MTPYEIREALDMYADDAAVEDMNVVYVSWVKDSAANLTDKVSLRKFDDLCTTEYVADRGSPRRMLLGQDECWVPKPGWSDFCYQMRRQPDGLLMPVLAEIVERVDAGLISDRGFTAVSDMDPSWRKNTAALLLRGSIGVLLSERAHAVMEAFNADNDADPYIDDTVEYYEDILLGGTEQHHAAMNAYPLVRALIAA